MSFSRPIAASSRQLDIQAAVNQVTFAWPLPLFDPADLEIQLQAAPSPLFQPITGGVSVALGTADASAVVTFLQAPCTDPKYPVVVRLIGRRVQSRLGNVTRGGTVSSTALETELDVESIVLQELRRDIDQAVTAAAQALALVTANAAGATGVKLWQLETALAQRGELQTILNGVQVLPSGDPTAIAFSCRDTVFAADDQALAWLSTTLADAPGVAAARLALAAARPPQAGVPADWFREVATRLGLYADLEAALPADPTTVARIEWDASPVYFYNGAVLPLFASVYGAGTAAVSLPLFLPPPAGAPLASMRQYRTALAVVGLLAAAEAAIEALPQPNGVLGFSTADLASFQWNGGSGVAIGDPLTTVQAPALGLTPTQMAALVVYAAGITFA